MKNELNYNERITKSINTGIYTKGNQTKCPKCGATDISLNVKNGKLRCNYCRYEIEPAKLEEIEKNIGKLEGEIIGYGAKNIVGNINDIITFKCSSCGAEVVIDTSKLTQARCHWCRNALSINQQIPNGAVPDLVLPFKVTKQEAKQEIEKFVRKRRLFAHPKFKKEFTIDNVMGVYLPYIIFDANIHANMKGQGEVITGKSEDENVNLYEIEREFDITIEGLTVEASKDKLDTSQKNKTINIINSIMPFDTENCVKWDSNYIKGYTSEKRDINVEQLKDFVKKQSKDIVKATVDATTKFYDGGVKWSKEEINLKGQQWKSAHLPVWIYSYQQKSRSGDLLHYVVVNGRTKETMGSIPMHKPKLFIVFFALEFLALTLLYLVPKLGIQGLWTLLIFLLFPIAFSTFDKIYERYRNESANHKYENETKIKVKNLRKVDKFIKKMKNIYPEN